MQAISPFELDGVKRASLPVLIAAPHGGRDYPAVDVARFRDPENDPIRLEDRLVDILARDIAHATGSALLIARAPRATIDLNRDPNDIDWGMIGGTRPLQTKAVVAAKGRARSGLGLVPRRLGGKELWKGPLKPEELQRRIDTVHAPYHAALHEALEALRSTYGTALLLDLHSMPPLGRGNPVQFVVGDRFGSSCATHLSYLVQDFFEERGRPVSRNRPYAGGYIIDRHGKPRRGIHAMQLEICRSLYLDEAGRSLTGRSVTIVRLIADLARALADELFNMGQGGAREAAE